MIKIDTSKFEKSIRKLAVENEKATKDALYKVGIAIINKAEPLVPILEGNLVGSASITVGKEVKQYNSQTSDSGISSRPPILAGAKPFELRVGYNMPYAHRLHEYPFNPGPKSKIKGLTKPGYKFLTRAIRQLDIPGLFKRFYKLKDVIL